MPDKNDSIEGFTVGFQLGEALFALRLLATELDAGELRESADEAGLAVDLALILDHLCLAWHQRRMRFEDDVTPDDWNTMSSAIPNWDGHFVLKEPGIDYPVIG